MKKYLSILFTAIFAAMFVFSTISCSKDDSATDSNIVGTWKRVDAIYEDGVQYWQFKKNGTWFQIETEADYCSYGTWRLSGDILTLTLESEKEPPTSIKIKELTKESMTFTLMDELLDEFGELIEPKFKRVPDSEIKKYLENKCF